MIPWASLHQSLIKKIIETEHSLESRARGFVGRLTTIFRKNGYTLDHKAEEEIGLYQQGNGPAIREAITLALRSVAATVADPANADAFIKRAAVEAFNRRHPDGMTLSTRIWKLNAETRSGIESVLRDGVRMVRSCESITADMQRAIDVAQRTRNAIVNAERVRWVDELADAGRAVIKNPEMRSQWLKTVGRVEHYITGLAEEGTAQGARRLLARINEAVATGRTDLIDAALEDRILGKQLFNLKRIAQTEQATAWHNAVIDLTMDDELVIGYLWQLSGTHANHKPDICDAYSAVDFGMGRGVWPKNSVPRNKPHPNCLCRISARTTRVKDRGSVDPATLALHTT